MINKHNINDCNGTDSRNKNMACLLAKFITFPLYHLLEID